MRILLIILILLSLSCIPATTVQAENSRPRPSEFGWWPVDQNGRIWTFQNNAGQMLGKCALYGKEWQGVIYFKRPSFSKYDYVYTTNMESLYECVSWIEKWVYGGYYY